MMTPERPMMATIERAMDELFRETPSMDRNRPYKGQPHTGSGERGKTEVVGLTMRDIRDCFIRAVFLSCENDHPKNRPYYDEALKGEGAALCLADVWELEGDFDMIAVGQNLGCEIERMMGIFPNVPELKLIGSPE